MTDRNITTGECPHGIDRISRYCEVCDGSMDCPDPHETIRRLTKDNEEMIRGVTEMAERFTARMDAANAQIEECRECLILTVKELELPPNAPTATLYTKGILTRSRKALGLQP